MLNLDYLFWAIVVIVIAGVALLLWTLFVNAPSLPPPADQTNETGLIRTLMIETISGIEIKAQNFTISALESETDQLAKKWVTREVDQIKARDLLQQRNQKIYDYYQTLRSIMCPNGTCVYTIDMSTKSGDIDFNAIDEATQVTKSLEVITDSLIKLANGNRVKLRVAVSNYHEQVIRAAKAYLNRDYGGSIRLWKQSEESAREMMIQLN